METTTPIEVCDDGLEAIQRILNKYTANTDVEIELIYNYTKEAKSYDLTFSMPYDKKKAEKVKDYDHQYKMTSLLLYAFLTETSYFRMPGVHKISIKVNNNEPDRMIYESTSFYIKNGIVYKEERYKLNRSLPIPDSYKHPSLAIQLGWRKMYKNATILIHNEIGVAPPFPIKYKVFI